VKTSFKQDNSAFDASSFTGIRFWVRGNGSFQFRTLQPTIQDYDDYSTGDFQAAPEWKQITIWFKDLKQAGWGVYAPLTALDRTISDGVGAGESPTTYTAGLVTRRTAP